MLKKLRIKFGMTQVEMAKELGVTQQYISMIERGCAGLSYQMNKKINEFMIRRL